MATVGEAPPGRVASLASVGLEARLAGSDHGLRLQRGPRSPAQEPPRLVSQAAAICGEDRTLALMAHTIAWLMRLSGASVGLFYTVDKRLLKFSGAVVFSVTGSLTQTDLQLSLLRYREHHHALDPFAPRRAIAASLGVIDASDVADAPSLRRHPYFTEYLRGLGMGSQTSLLLRGDGRVVAGVDLLREPPASPIAPHELALLRANHPLLEHAYDCARRLPSKQSPPTAAVHGLTRRELEVARLVARGVSNAEAAHALAISESTVKTHLLHVFEKLQVRSRSQLVSLLAQPHGSGDGLSFH